MLADRGWFGRRTSTFTLQWHLTNDCELSCTHCYDRVPRPTLDFEHACDVLFAFTRFCQRRNVRGHVCLTGGNPALFPGFFELVREAHRAGHVTSILGNPMSSTWLTKLCEIGRPRSFQVSLEGLIDTNDRIRGPGHFARTIRFLQHLRKAGIRSHVMLTLHRDNMHEVLELARRLIGVADRFTFNRLCAPRGSALELPSREAFARFVMDYLRAARTNPILGFKENLFNVVRHKNRLPLFRGCTGFGCGAAFNFVAVLPDGRVDACRKFPSPIGAVTGCDFDAIYESSRARQYREGSKACRRCPVRNVCGGCLAVTNAAGLDPLQSLDPYCFMTSPKTSPTLFDCANTRD